MHAAALVAARHLLMQDAAARSHPLHIARAEAAAVAEAVAVLDAAGEDVGDRLDPAVRMPREALEIIVRPLVAKVVEEQERIELGRIAEAERALQLDAGAFDRRPRMYHSLDRSNGHCGAPVPLYLLDASHSSTGRAGWRLACSLPRRHVSTREA